MRPKKLFRLANHLVNSATRIQMCGSTYRGQHLRSPGTTEDQEVEVYLDCYHLKTFSMPPDHLDSVVHCC